MEEIEVRILNVDVEKTKEILTKNGAVLVKKENQINNLYDFEDDRLLKENGYVRLRIVADLLNNKHLFYMTMKKIIPHNTYKVSDEQEIKIDDPAMGDLFLKSLGLCLKQSIQKYRESYSIKNTLVEIDINDKNFYPLPYIEIEASSDEEIEEVVKMLGYTMEDTTQKTIFDIVKENNM